MLLQAPTIVELFARRIEADGPQPALGIKRSGQYHWLTHNDVATDVRRLASAIVSLGVQPGESIALISENRYEWIITDLAIQLALAVHVPIQPTLAGPQIAWQLRHCGCRVVFISGPHQAAKLAPLAAELPAGLQCISFDPSGADIPVCHFAELCERGNPAEGKRLEKVAARKSRRNP